MLLFDIKYDPIFGEVGTWAVVVGLIYFGLFSMIYENRKRDKEFDEFLKKRNREKENAKKNIY